MDDRRMKRGREDRKVVGDAKRGEEVLAEDRPQKKGQSLVHYLNLSEVEEKETQLEHN
jgi:hypothetical protein